MDTSLCQFHLDHPYYPGHIAQHNHRFGLRASKRALTYSAPYAAGTATLTQDTESDETNLANCPEEMTLSEFAAHPRDMCLCRRSSQREAQLNMRQSPISVEKGQVENHRKKCAKVCSKSIQEGGVADTMKGLH